MLECSSSLVEAWHAVVISSSCLPLDMSRDMSSGKQLELITTHAQLGVDEGATECRGRRCNIKKEIKRLHAHLQHCFAIEFSLFGLAVYAQRCAVGWQRRFAVHALESLLCKAHDATYRSGGSRQLNGTCVVPCTSTGCQAVLLRILKNARSSQ